MKPEKPSQPLVDDQGRISLYMTKSVRYWTLVMPLLLIFGAVLMMVKYGDVEQIVYKLLFAGFIVYMGVWSYRAMGRVYVRIVNHWMEPVIVFEKDCVNYDLNSDSKGTLYIRDIKKITIHSQGEGKSRGIQLFTKRPEWLLEFKFTNEQFALKVNSWTPWIASIHQPEPDGGLSQSLFLSMFNVGQSELYEELKKLYKDELVIEYEPGEYKGKSLGWKSKD